MSIKDFKNSLLAQLKETEEGQTIRFENILVKGKKQTLIHHCLCTAKSHTLEFVDCKFDIDMSIVLVKVDLKIINCQARQNLELVVDSVEVENSQFEGLALAAQKVVLNNVGAKALSNTVEL